MAEPRPLASLTSGLLARKGAARPAMRRQSMLGVPENNHALDDLGWNDMGHDTPAAEEPSLKHHAGLSPMHGATVHALDNGHVIEPAAPAQAPAVVEQQRRVEAVISAPAPAQKPRAEAGARGRFAFTLRLDNDRHLMLRLASATSNRSAQQIMVALLDEYFSRQPSVAALAAQAGADVRAVTKRGE